MAFLKNKHSIWFIFWLALLSLAIFAMPDESSLKSDQSVPDTYQSTQAHKLANQFSKKDRGAKTVIAVYNNGKDPLVADQNKAIDATVTSLKANADKYHITGITDISDGAEEKSQLVSKDKSTRLVQLTVKTDDIPKMKQTLARATKAEHVASYITGSDILDQDFGDATSKGIAKTEVIAIIFIFIVLIFVFKSPITPLLSLATVGVSAIVGISLVYNMVKYFGLAYSDLTEAFIIIVLFGIGTDYNILLYNEFRSSLSQGLDKIKAAREAVRVGGRTILYAGLSVLIGMGTLYFSDFYLYKSAFGIAIGVAVLLAVLLTLNPFFMTIFGEKMFWPKKNFEEEGESRIWHFFAKTSLARPFVALGILVIMLVPVAMQTHGDLNYDSAVEVSDQTPSKHGYNLIQEHFSKGMAASTSIYIKTNKTLDNQNDLRVIDQITQNLKTIDSVDKVMSLTQPIGKKIADLYVKNQLSDVSVGLGDATKGLNQIKGGLGSAKNELDGTDVTGTAASVSDLATGSAEVATGAAALQSGIGQITANIRDLNSQLATGTSDNGQIQQLMTALPELNQAITNLNDQVSAVNSNGNDAIQQNLSKINTATAAIGTQLQTINNTVESITKETTIDANAIIDTIKQSGVVISADQERAIHDSISNVLKKRQDAMTNLQSTVGSSLGAIAQSTETIGTSDQALADNITGLNSATEQMQSAVSDLATQANQLLPASTSAISQLTDGMTTLKSGAGQLTQALDEVDSQTGALTSGAQQVASGNAQIATGFGGMVNQTKTLSQGLADSNSGLATVSSGTQDVNKYVAALQKSISSESFYMPEDEIHKSTFKSSLDTYLSDDKQMTTLTVYLKGDPTTVAATKEIENLNAVVKASIAGTDLKDATVAIGGTTSSTKDLNSLATKDFLKTAVIMLVVIMLALLFITRSFWQSVAIVGTLLISYYVSLNVVHWLSEALLGQHTLTWNTPFFSFVMLIALGVDYTIFLMLKYRDEVALGGKPQVNVTQTILKSVAMIGTVVISAAVILAGTFAALIPSGVVTLIQVALVVTVGLILLVVLIPLILPAVIKLTDGRLK